MSKVLREQEIKEILYGATFLGAGGGGSLSDGLVMLQDNIDKRGSVEVEMVTAQELKKGSYAVMIAGMGAPTVLQSKEEKFKYEAGYAVDAMSDIAFMSGKSVDAVIPIEYGAVNCFIPMIACMERNLPLVDADACGRAVPGLDVTMFDINGIAFSPAVISSENGDIINIYPSNNKDGKAAENMCRYLCGVYGYIIGLGGWLTACEEIDEKLIPGSISYAQKVGKAILEAKESKADIETVLRKMMDVRLLAKGIIVDQANVMKNGHDVGCTTIETDQGEKYFIDIKNESIVFRSEKEVMLTCPDMICAINLDDYNPLTNADIKIGMHVGYFAVPAPTQWYTEKALNAWKPYFEAIGYEGEVIRF